MYHGFGVSKIEKKYIFKEINIFIQKGHIRLIKSDSIRSTMVLP